MFKFSMPSGAGGSPMSMMNNQQRLQALGSAFSGDQRGLASIMSQLPQHGGGQPVTNQQGQDISAAFGGDLGAHHSWHRRPPEAEEGDEGDQSGGQGGGSLSQFGILPQLPMGLIPALLGMKRGFGFGGLGGK